MASVTMSTNDQFRGPAILLIADSGTMPTEELGYTREGIEVAITRETERDYVQETLDSVDQFTTRRTVMISGQLAQFNLSVLSRVLGITAEGASLPLSGAPEELEVALRLIGSRKNGGPVHYYLARARAAGNTTMAWRREANGGIAFSFEQLSHASNRLMLSAATASTATLSSGAFARVNAAPTTTLAWYKLSGEGGAADTLTEITGTDLTDGEAIRLQIAATAQPITIAHASGVIELKTASDWTMSKLSDWIDLYYDSTATAWKELARLDT